jgi:threonine/homoserine efflux transporter RhtA
MIDIIQSVAIILLSISVFVIALSIGKLSSAITFILKYLPRRRPRDE